MEWASKTPFLCPTGGGVPSLGPATSHSSCSRPIGSIRWFWERISNGKCDWVPPDCPAGNGQKPPGTTEAGKGGREDSLDVTVHHQSAAGPCAPSGLANALMYLQRPLECLRSFKASSMGRGDSGHAPLLPLGATYLKGE